MLDNLRIQAGKNIKKNGCFKKRTVLFSFILWQIVVE